MNDAVVRHFNPYTVVDDDRDPEPILDSIHRGFHLSMGSDTTKGARFDKEISFEISDFAWMATELARIPELESVTALAFAQGRITPGKIPLVIRHDLDGDLDSALKMAEIQAQHGLRGTFYVLPSDRYYSDYYTHNVGARRRFASEVIRRFRRMVPHYRRLQELGHEVGLHYFPYGTYREKLMDGAQSIVEEVRWLRANGIDVRGGVGHSSRVVQGADMAEIFEEFFNPNVNFETATTRLLSAGPVVFDGVEMPRRVLSLKDVPFDYVGEFVRKTPAYWAVRENGMIKFQPPVGEPQARTDYAGPRGMIEQIKARVAGRGLYVVTIMVHPVHMQARAAETRAREVAVRGGGTAPHVELPGSQATLREPASINICKYQASNGTPMEVASVVNSLGFLDYEPSPRDEKHRRQIALLGDGILDAPHLQISQKLQGWLRKLYLHEDMIRTSTRAYAASHADLAFYLHAIELQLRERVPDAWVLVLDAGAAPSREDLRTLLERLRATRRPIVCLVRDDDDTVAATAGGMITEILKISWLDMARRQPVGFDSQAHLGFGRRVKDALAVEFGGSANRPPLERRRNRIREEMNLTADAAEALGSLKLRDMPEALTRIGPKDMAGLSDQAFARFRFVFERIDAGEDKGLRAEIDHMLKPTIFAANFQAVIGHASRIPNLETSAGLDLGCSSGLKTVLLKHFGAGRIVGSDVMPSLIRSANTWLEQSGVAGMRFFTNPADSLPFEDGQFDWITCMGLYANLNPAATVGLFRNCARVLKRGGRLLLHDSANPHHEESAIRIRAHHRQQELGDGSPESPNGVIYHTRFRLIADRFPELERTKVAELARLTGYMLEAEILAAVKRYVADGTLPTSPFVVDDLSRIPLWPSGNAAMRTTDPYLMRAELMATGFEVRFRRPALGADIPDEEIGTYFKSAPGVFVTAEKVA